MKLPPPDTPQSYLPFLIFFVDLKEEQLPPELERQARDLMLKYVEGVIDGADHLHTRIEELFESGRLNKNQRDAVHELIRTFAEKLSQPAGAQHWLDRQGAGKHDVMLYVKEAIAAGIEEITAAHVKKLEILKSPLTYSKNSRFIPAAEMHSPFEHIGDTLIYDISPGAAYIAYGPYTSFTPGKCLATFHLIHEGQTNGVGVTIDVQAGTKNLVSRHLFASSLLDPRPKELTLYFEVLEENVPWDFRVHVSGGNAEGRVIFRGVTLDWIST